MITSTLESQLEEPTLVLIDLQQMFVNQLDEMLVILSNVVRDAMACNAAILTVEMNGCGPTHELIANLLVGYPRHRTVRKPGQDGSAEILEKCWQHEFCATRFTLCGVALACCVLKTALGLASFDPTVSITILQEGTDAYADECATISYHPCIALRRSKTVS